LVAVPKVPTLMKELQGPLLGWAQPSTPGLNSSFAYEPASPVIAGGGANVSYPSNYRTLADFALGLINQDRSDFGLGPVQLSTLPVAQQHADSMLVFAYFSHFDTQGYKPYMRYTLLGGEGAVEENVAWSGWTAPHYTSTGSVEAGIKSLEYVMMYNDSACCQNGHRENILNPSHNRVSIGVAYNSTSLYFVEDFENDYINLTMTVSASTVSLEGVPRTSGVNPSQILVFYDPTPTSLTASDLNAGPHEYGPGEFVGGVLPPCLAFCPKFSNATTVYASTWQGSATHVSVVFSLASLTNQYGPGVYTIYLMAGKDTSSSYTSLSIFVG
jgi:uncharacterized protein YkwD